MKVIDKLQQGGGIPSFVSYTNVPQSQPTAPYVPEAKQQEAPKEELLDKSMITALYQKGLPSDVEKFLEESGLFSESILSNPYKKGNTSTQYKALLKILPRITMNKEEYSRAVQEATKNNALKETAIDTDGRVFALGQDGQVNKKFISQLEEGEQTLTVGQIAENRAYSSNLAFNTNAITAIANSTSIEQVNKAIWDVIKNLGSDTRGNEYFRSKDQKKAKDGIDKILEEGADGVYKVTSKEVSQDTQAKYALNYILATLPTNQKVLIQDYARKSGLDTQAGALQIITSMIQSGTSSTQDIKVDYDKQATNGADTDKDGNKVKLDIKPQMQYQMGEGGSETTIKLNPGKTSEMLTEGLNYGQPISNDGNPIVAGSMESFLNSGMGTITDVSNGFYIGNQRVDSSRANEVYYDGTQLNRAWLPYTTDSDGTVHPNFDLLDAFTKADKKITELGENVTTTAIENILNTESVSNSTVLGDYMSIDPETGSIRYNKQKMMPFLMTNVMASGKSNWFGDGHEGVINPDKARDFVTNIESVKGANPESIKKTMQERLSTKYNVYEPIGDIYTGVAFLPLTDSAIRGMSASKEYPTLSSGNSQDINDLRVLKGNQARMSKERAFVEAPTSRIQ